MTTFRGMVFDPRKCIFSSVFLLRSIIDAERKEKEIFAPVDLDMFFFMFKSARSHKPYILLACEVSHRK